MVQLDSTLLVLTINIAAWSHSQVVKYSCFVISYCTYCHIKFWLLLMVASLFKNGGFVQNDSSEIPSDQSVVCSVFMSPFHVSSFETLTKVRFQVLSTIENQKGVGQLESNHMVKTHLKSMIGGTFSVSCLQCSHIHKTTTGGH